MHDEDEAGQAPSMARKHVETERKYEGTALPSSLDSVPGVATAQWVDQQDLDAVYYDSPDLRLLRRRITLRRRTGGDDAGWHLKLPLADDARAEIQLPLAAGSKRRVPAELTARVAAFTRDATLLPVAHLRTHRARRLLQDEEGATLAEVTEDRVAAQLLDPGQASSGTSTEISGWTEFEVELADGTPKLLDRIDTAFTEAGLARSAWPSKLARAVGTTAGPADGEQGPADRKLGPADGQLTAARAEQPGTAGAVVMTAYRALVGELLTLDAAVRRGEADSVHRMRVTARRLRSLLKAHHRLFDRRRSDPLAAELQWIGRVLGEARDQEVLGEHLVAGLDAVPAQVRRHALRGRITERYAHAYRRAWRQAVRELASPRYFTLLDRLDDFAARPPLRGRAGAAAVGYCADVLRQEQRRMLKRLDRALRTARGPQRDGALHRARKAAKRARYTAEAAGSGLPRHAAKRTAKYGARMKRLHKVLGVHQDSVVTRQALLTLDAGSTESTDRAKHDAFAYGVLHEGQRQAAERAVRRLPRLRRRSARRKLTSL